MAIQKPNYMFFWENRTPHSGAVPVTDQNYNQLLDQPNLGVLLYFWADWSKPCAALTLQIDDLANTYADQPVVIGQVNVDQQTAVADFLQIKTVPALIFIKNQRIAGNFMGAVPQSDLVGLLDQLIAL